MLPKQKQIDSNKDKITDNNSVIDKSHKDGFTKTTKVKFSNPIASTASINSRLGSKKQANLYKKVLNSNKNNQKKKLSQKYNAGNQLSSEDNGY